MKIKTLLILFLITLLGAFFRLYEIQNNPASLNVDEVSNGYNAYSILKTGKDEYGNFMPLSFRSLGDYKPPLYIYLLVPSINIFGLNEFALRFPNALISILTIPLVYLLFFRITKNNKIALFSSFFIAISPWNIYLSRFALETPLATFLVLVGLLFLLFSEEKPKIYFLIPSAVCFAMSMATYQTERLFVPLFLLGYAILQRNIIQKNIKVYAAFLFIFLLFNIPLLLSFLGGTAQSRAGMMFIDKDVNFVRDYSLILDPVSLFIYWLNKTLSYFSSSFLFYDGLQMTTKGSFNLGILYLFEIPLLILGLIIFVTKQIPHKKILILWFLIGLIPASLTLGDLNARRLLTISPVIALILSYGSEELIFYIKRIKDRKILALTLLIITILVVWNLCWATLVLFVHFPKQSGEGFMEGTKEAVRYIAQNQDKYKEIVFDPVRGLEGPYITGVPYLYFLFYTKYDPAKYQNMEKFYNGNSFSFDRYIFRPINWRCDHENSDCSKKDTLFIGSMWSLPPADIKEDEVIGKIMMSNGKEAYRIVNPKPKKRIPL